jgi:PAS domain S-box-containing protein
MSRDLLLTGRERTFDPGEIIVSKTDPQGRITYANQVFCRIAEFTEAELIGKPHSIVRHPDMPRCVFKVLWDTIQAGSEIFAYVINRSKRGDHYWVFAHVTPSYDAAGRMVGYHSNRRVPDRSILKRIRPIYQALLSEEQKHHNPKDQWRASLPILLNYLKEQGKTYEELIFSWHNQVADSDSRVGAGAHLHAVGAGA